MVLFSIVLLLGGAMWLRLKAPFFPYKEQVMGIYIVQDDILRDKTKKETAENPGITFENAMLPYDTVTNTLYLPQSVNDEQWSGYLSVQIQSPDKIDYYICSPDDEKWFTKTEAIWENHKYTVWLVSESDYYEFQMVVTGTPVMAISTERMEVPEAPTYEEDPDGLYFGSEPLYYGKVTVIDPDMSENGYTITEAGICYHKKGLTSGNFVKKSYSIELKDENECDVNISLLGMRKDNSWKLNSLYTDSSRIREITASQIWASFDVYDVAVNEPGPKMEYVELVLDDEYQGLYCLVEPVDRKKLQLGLPDVLYKIIGWEIPDDEDIQDSVNRRWKIRSSIRIRYPKEISDYEAAWLPMRNYLELFYRNNESDYYESLTSVDLNNIMDFSFFVMATSASDNSFKNSYLAAYRTEKGHIIYQIPWDLDYTFGNVYTYADLPVKFDPDVSLIYTNEVLLRLYNVAPQEIGPQVWERWNEYRNSFLGYENIENLMLENRDYLLKTGAAVREIEKWPDVDISMDIDHILEYQAARLEWLDEYYSEWENRR